MADTAAQVREMLISMGLDPSKPIPGGYNGDKWLGGGKIVPSIAPHDNSILAECEFVSEETYEILMGDALEAQKYWRALPAPTRGLHLRAIGEAIRVHKEALGRLVSIEMGKVLSEGLGEVQETIDVMDQVLGLTRSFGGATVASERPEHVLQERWKPIGAVGVITAWNFPNAVLGWNAGVAFAVGDVVFWKGASATPLTTIATTKIIQDCLSERGCPAGIMTCVMGGGASIGQKMLEDRRLPLISFTGSCDVGRHVGAVCAKRFGQTILECGGNNCAIIAPSADLKQAIPNICFGFVGTTGQRCTSTRRVVVHETHYEKVKESLVKAVGSLESRIGHPWEDGVLIGPMYHEDGVAEYLEGIENIKKQGGKILAGGYRLDRPGCFVAPTVVEVTPDLPILQTEIFAPIVYIMKYTTLEEAILINNGVPQGLSSTLFTNDLREEQIWLGPTGSDCGIVNINASTSGAETGLGFGGNKETGWGREAGSDCWKYYCSRSSCCVNYSGKTVLAQGVVFDI